MNEKRLYGDALRGLAFVMLVILTIVVFIKVVIWLVTL